MVREGKWGGSGEIGSRAGFRCPCPRGRGGSSPLFRTSGQFCSDTWVSKCPQSTAGRITAVRLTRQTRHVMGGRMALSFELDPPLTEDLRVAILKLWVEVTNTGGAVGFVAPVT